MTIYVYQKQNFIVHVKNQNRVWFVLAQPEEMNPICRLTCREETLSVMIFAEKLQRTIHILYTSSVPKQPTSETRLMTY